MLKNAQTCFKNFAMCEHRKIFEVCLAIFSTLWMRGLIHYITSNKIHIQATTMYIKNTSLKVLILNMFFEAGTWDRFRNIMSTQQT